MNQQKALSTVIHISIASMLVFACTKKSVIEPDTPPQNPADDPSQPKEYQAAIPENKLPWPHHAPEITNDEYQMLINDVFILNNFGQYQGVSQLESDCYMHDGLDLVLFNGTPIYSVQSGYVIHAYNHGCSKSWCIIEDEDNLGYAWEYAHMIPENVHIGDYIAQGSQIGRICFDGVDHLHLSRIHLRPGKTWNDYWEWEYINPDTCFVIIDRLPPVIEYPFYYFRNNSDSQILDERSGIIVLSGDVDIVVGMREKGLYARGLMIYYGKEDPDTLYGDRLCITNIDYEISGEHIETQYFKSFDFRKIRLMKNLSDGGISNPSHTLTIYKYYNLIHPEGPVDYNRLLQHYIITNTDGTGETIYIDPSHRKYCWDTDETDVAGTPLFPNGEYTITVHAYDNEGNCRTATENVFVDN